jgi:hypothetical protein
MNEKLSLNQISSLVRVITQDEYLWRTYDLSDPDEVWDKISGLDMEGFRKFKYCFGLNEHSEINKIMEEMGFKIKDSRNSAGKHL